MVEKRPSKRSDRLRAPRFWLGVALSLLGLYLAAKDVHWSELAAALSQADRLILLLALASVLLTTWAKALRWRLLFYPMHSQLSVLNCLSALLVGQLANKLLPARLGDFTRVYFMDDSTGTGRIPALATTVVEKALDGVMLLSLIATLSPWVPMPSWLRRSTLILSSLLVVLVLAVTLLANQHRRVVRTLERWIDDHRTLAFLRVLERLADASGHVGALLNARVLAQLYGWTALIWVLGLATNMLVFRALDMPVSPLVSALLLVVLMTGAVLPTSPLEVGVFHYLCVLTLSLFAVERDLALSYAVLLHLVVHVPIVLGGVLVLWTHHHNRAELDHTATGTGK